MDAEDKKLIVLARATATRTGAAAAAIRDSDGRTYAAAQLSLPSTQVSATAAAIAMAHSSGVKSLESVVILEPRGANLSEASPDVVAPEELATTGIPAEDQSLVNDFAGPGVPIYRVSVTGEILAEATS